LEQAWFANNWNGACEDIAKIAKPTLIITGTDDNAYVQTVNYFVIAKKIPWSWHVQIKEASHVVMDQYPNGISKILQTLLSIKMPLQSN
jgi:pimeloyl-ACP methyl ester carboxylesterase